MKSTILLFAFCLLTSFDRGEKEGCADVRLFEKADFPVGVAINMKKLENDEQYRNLVIAQFNSITAEKCMKANFIHPEEKKFDFAATDSLIAFCSANHIRLHGHTLVWHKNNPAWMESFNGGKAAWEAMLRDHIHGVVEHCKGYVHSWDVVNEAFNQDGSLRENIWLKNIGESYIEKSFVYAREADPTATLFYNDFDLESSGSKLRAVLNMVQALKNDGVTVDGVGMQMHISVSFPFVSDINRAAAKIAERGLLVHYSELDISLLMSDKLFRTNTGMLQSQRVRMQEIVEGYMRLKKSSRFGITVWGVSDADTWLSKKNKKDRPLLFDVNYRPKPAYCGFLDGLAG